MTPILYHNPRCSKSREALSLLKERGVEFEVVRYLERPPDRETLQRIAESLGEPVRNLIRTGEPAWSESGVDPDELGDDELLAFIAEHPGVMQRPVLVVGGRARIGRPPERILEILAQ